MAKNMDFDHTVLLLHGGGALGAYEVGVFKALQEYGYQPDWIIGTSIGSINSAIIAGNPPEKQLEKLQAFWESIATIMPETPDTLNNLAMEKAQHYLSAAYTLMNGQRGFFTPRAISPWFSLQSTADKLSFYDSSPLRKTLLDLIDFNLINEAKTRLSMGSVRVNTGHLVYFDNTKMHISVDHVMASCALPPGLPAVRIDDHFYWDGGVHSNTQLNLLMSEREPLSYLCFLVNLFDTQGITPTNMEEVLMRQKDIGYASHTRSAILNYRHVHNLRRAIRILADQLPEETKLDPEIKKIINLGQTSIIQAARFHYKNRISDLSSKDYEFSLPSIKAHMHNGYKDVQKTMPDPPWENPCPREVGLMMYEVTDNTESYDSLYEETTNYHVTNVK